TRRGLVVEADGQRDDSGRGSGHVDGPSRQGKGGSAAAEDQRCSRRRHVPARGYRVTVRGQRGPRKRQAQRLRDTAVLLRESPPRRPDGVDYALALNELRVACIPEIQRKG